VGSDILRQSYPQHLCKQILQGCIGSDDFILAVIGFAANIALAFVQFPGGYLADKHGRRWLVYTVTFGVSSSSLFFVFDIKEGDATEAILFVSAHAVWLVYQRGWRISAERPKR
jgi:MFS family permease